MGSRSLRYVCNFSVRQDDAIEVLGRLVVAAVVAVLAVAAPGQAAGGAGLGGGSWPASSVNSTSGSGGAPLGGLAPTHKPNAGPAPPSKHARGRWLGQVTITEYWPAPEAWFIGRLVSAPGLSGKHRIDWLYSAAGISMQGEGIGLNGRTYHIDALGDAGWVTASGAPTRPADGWAAGPPYWRAGGYWRSRSRAVTFPLQGGGWAAGAGRTYVPLPGVSFAVGSSLPLRFLRSIAVDPRVIPLGSRVYVPAYAGDGYGGWFVAQDTGGAISGRHIDVYRQPPAARRQSGQYLGAQRIYVIKPHH